MAQSLITTVDIFQASRSNFPHGEASTHWNVMDTAPWELKSGLFLFSALFPGATISGIDVICVNFAGPAETEVPLGCRSHHHHLPACLRDLVVPNPGLLTGYFTFVRQCSQVSSPLWTGVFMGMQPRRRFSPRESSQSCPEVQPAALLNRR